MKLTEAELFNLLVHTPYRLPAALSASKNALQDSFFLSFENGNDLAFTVRSFYFPLEICSTRIKATFSFASVATASAENAEERVRQEALLRERHGRSDQADAETW